ncbi:ferredoxin [Rubritalea spongiae]|uniref:Ferredoxin n=1 Tax=Rubritalea spongiae TaxID=430797 RepID=A0ABW5E6H6_9BACT
MEKAFQIVKKNVLGRYFVDESCIYCELCLEAAPKNFAYDETKGEAYVCLQPSSDTEHRQMKAAIDDCPIHCIHDSVTQPDDFP